MKMMKKITTLLLAVCLAVPCFSFAAFAAEGTLMFSDPTTAAGQEVAVDVKIRAESAIGEGKVTVTYDAAALEFVSGTNATGGTGTVSLTGAGDGSSTELSFTLNFKALKEGEAELTVSEYTASLQNGENLTLTLGSSKVAIGPGDGTTPEPVKEASAGAVSITIAENTYTLNENFADIDIPTGFARATMPYEGEDRQVMQQEGGELFLLYLQGSDGKSEFFIYDRETDEFTPFVKIDISEETYIMLLSKADKSKLPSSYVKTTLDAGEGQEFPAWQNAENADYYIVYALSSQGTKGYYQFDKKDGTYQRFIVPEEEKSTDAKGFLGKVTKIVDQHIATILIVVWALFLALIILIIVLGVKLHHRNQELDDLYEAEEEVENDPVLNDRKNNRNATVKRIVQDDFDDDFDDDPDDDGEFDEYEDLDRLDIEEQVVARATAQVNNTQQTGRRTQPIQNAKPVAKAQPVRKAQPERPVQQEEPVKRAENRNVNYERFDDDDFSVDFIDLDD